jgi:hypothetical protein
VDLSCRVTDRTTEHWDFLPLRSPLDRHGVELIRDFDVVEILRFADLLTFKCAVLKCESADSFIQTEA